MEAFDSFQHGRAIRLGPNSGLEPGEGRVGGPRAAGAIRGLAAAAASSRQSREPAAVRDYHDGGGGIEPAAGRLRAPPAAVHPACRHHAARPAKRARRTTRAFFPPLAM